MRTLAARITYFFWRVLRGRTRPVATFASFHNDMGACADRLGEAIEYLQAAEELAETRTLTRRLRAERLKLAVSLDVLERWAPIRRPKAQEEAE